MMIFVAGAALFSERPASGLVLDSLPPLAPHTSRALGGGWVHHEVELSATRVDLGHTGRHTHANWVVFMLPFDTTQRDVRNVRFRPRSLADTDVAALYTPLGCLPAPRKGPVEDPGWTKFTLTGIGGTRSLHSHALAPTHDSRAYAINVPTRVANVAACGERALASPASWRLVVSWESHDRGLGDRR